MIRQAKPDRGLFMPYAAMYFLFEIRHAADPVHYNWQEKKVKKRKERKKASPSEISTIDIDYYYMTLVTSAAAFD